MSRRLPLLEQPLIAAAEMDELIRQARNHGVSPSQRLPRQGRSGPVASPSLGSGVDFADPRPYHPGDDIRRIDWRSSARARMTLIRPVHAELEQDTALLLDLRAPMRFGTRRRLKAAQALRCALWNIASENDVQASISLTILSDQCRWLPRLNRQAALQVLKDTGSQPCPPREPDTNPLPWRRIYATLQDRLSEGSRLTLISDFHDLNEDDARALGALGRQLNVWAVRVFDSSENAPEQLSTSEWIWGALKRRIDQDSRPDQLAAIAHEHREQLNTLFRRAGIQALSISTEQDDLCAGFGGRS